MHWTAQIPKIAFSIGSLDITFYGLIITIGMLVSLAFAYVTNKKHGLTLDDALEIFLCAIPLGILCARFGHVFARPSEYFPSDYTFSDFLEIFAIWDGGLTILTGVLGGILGAFLWSKWRKVDFIKAADRILYIVLLTQAIGRWGNFFNQEIYGLAVTDPDMQWFPYAVEIAGEGWYQAIFFYESMANLLSFVVIGILVRHVNIKGYGVASYLIAYSTIRLIMEACFRNENIVSAPVVIIIMVGCSIVIAASIAYVVYAAVRMAKKGEKIWYGKGGIPAEVIGNIHLTTPKTPIDGDGSDDDTATSK